MENQRTCRGSFFLLPKYFKMAAQFNRGFANYIKQLKEFKQIVDKYN